MASARRGMRRSRNCDAGCVAASTVQKDNSEFTKRDCGGGRVAKQQPSESEIFSAVSSLYIDQMKPFSRLLRKRLVEQAVARGVETKECDAKWLRDFCTACPLFLVKPEDGREWSVTLANEAGSFIDSHDPVDNYPADMWRAFKAYFELMADDSDACLSGGRYGSACELVKRQLAFLVGFTLGQVCHILELAIQRAILGYHNGNVVPYQQSTSMLKSKCASEHRSIKDDFDGLACNIVDWETARAKLREILDGAIRRGATQVPLSNVKRLFRSLYGLDLSETSLGYSRLTDLLQDRQFADICTVELQERGYAVLPVLRSVESNDDSVDCAQGEATVHESLGCLEGSGEHADRLKFCPDEPLCLEDADSSEIPAVSPCFPFPMVTPSPSPQCPISHLDAGRSAWEATCKALGLPLQEANIVEDQPCRTVEDRLTLPCARFCFNEPLCIEEAGSSEVINTPTCLFPLMTPSPQTPCVSSSKYHKALSLPRSMQGSEVMQPWCWAASESSFSSCGHGEVRFCELEKPIGLSFFLHAIPPLRQCNSATKQPCCDIATVQPLRSAAVPVLRIAAFV